MASRSSTRGRAKKTTVSGTIKSKTASKSKSGKTKHTWDKNKAFIVYHSSGEAVSFQDIEEAEAHYKKMLVSQRKRCDVKTFDSQADFDAANIIIQSSSSDDSGDEKDTKEPPVAAKIPAVTPEKKVVANTVATAPALQTDAFKDMLKRVQLQISGSGAVFRVHYWPNVPSFIEKSIVFVEFIDSKSQMNHWLHKPDAYMHLMTVDAETPNERYIFPTDLHSLKKAMIRSEPCKRGSEPKHVKKTTTEGNVYSIYAEGMYHVVPTGLDENALKHHVSALWTKVINQKNMKQLYVLCVKELTSSSKVINKLENPATSPYWKQFKASLMPDNINMVKHTTLDELFTDSELPAVAALLCNVSYNRAVEENYSEDEVEKSEMRSFVFNMDV